MIASLLALPLILPAAPAAPAPAASPTPHPEPVHAQDDDPPPPIQVLDDDNYLLTFAAGSKDSDEGMTLEHFVQACQSVTATTDSPLTFTYDDETRGYLAAARVLLIGSKTVAKKDFYNFFQILLVINDFVCTEVGPDSISVILITSLDTGARSTIKARSVYVEPEDLHEYENQPATLITTVIHLPNTDVRQVTTALRQMFPDPNTQQMLPAGNTNSVVLYGFGTNVVSLARMLAIVDNASKVEPIVPQFEVIPLEYAAADEIASTIEELLEASRRAATSNARGQQPAQGATGQLQRGQTEAKILVNPRTNSLLVMAMPEDMPSIKDLIARLDVDIVERERTYHVYPLENVSALETAETLNQFLQDAARMDQARAQGQGQGQRGGASGGVEFVVVEDVQTNSLLIAASRSRYEELVTLIKRLDQRQDQVLIETALIELSGRDILNIGVELGLASIPGVGEDGGFGLTNFGLSTLVDTDNDGVPDTKVPNALGGLTAGILDGDDFSMPLLLNLLEERRNSNVLNVPSVLVNNNGNATVTTLDEQPTTTITASGGLGGQTQENFSAYESAGITMQISPSISASRYLRLGISLEVSTFIGAVGGPIPPARVTRTIQTTVNVPDGDTMVIGGIIVDNKNMTETQVPFFGDLPIIGWLFKNKASTVDRTALYFFVTPHILQDVAFADLAEISYRKKLEAANTIGFERIRLIDPHFGPDGNDLDLSGFDVPLYTAPVRGVEVAPAEVGIDPERARELLKDGARRKKERDTSGGTSGDGAQGNG
jgi:general secretion pathway protein D